MCGIATISIGRRSRGRIPYEKFRALTSILLEELQPRGYDASGIAVINDPDEAESWVFKKPLRPHCLVKRPKFAETLKLIGPHTNFVMLHARATTVGGTSDNVNNHPIIVPGFVGIHNGTLVNDDKLFEKFNLERSGAVDSEVIFRLYGHFTEQGLDPHQALQQTAANLRGAFTGALVDWKYANRMLMFKYGRPLHLISLPYFDMLITVSEFKFWKNARDKLGIKVKESDEIIYDKAGLSIDVNSPNKLEDSINHFDLPVKEEYRSGYRYSSWLAAYHQD